MKLHGDWWEPDLPERDMEEDAEDREDPNDDWEYDDDDPRSYHGRDE